MSENFTALVVVAKNKDGLNSIIMEYAKTIWLGSSIGRMD